MCCKLKAIVKQKYVAACLQFDTDHVNKHLMFNLNVTCLKIAFQQKKLDIITVVLSCSDLKCLSLIIRLCIIANSIKKGHLYIR